MSGEVRTRFAPSPTGYLHVGGARTALFNWLYARRTGGRLILRIEDTDVARNAEGGLDAILGGLRWLGLNWDEGPEAGGDRGPYFQSQRREIYDAHLRRLEEKGATYEEPGGAVRFRASGRKVVVEDLVCGRVEFQRDEPDMTLRRPNGSYIFHFVNVVDDLEMGVTHVIRGEDHLSNTPKHIELFEALGARPPVYAHIPLLLNPDGSKMSKRDQGASLGDYIERGFLPAAVANYLALLGWSSKDDRERFSLEELTERFDFNGVQHANASFDFRKCVWLNGQYLMDVPAEDLYAASRPFLEREGLLTSLEDEELARGAVVLVQKRVSLLSEVPAAVRFFFSERCDYDLEALGKLSADADASAKLAALQEAFANCDGWDEASLRAALAAAGNAVATAQGKMMFPLRLAVTGSAAGPDLTASLLLLGKQKVLHRLEETMERVARPAP
ncbi:MAG TPA: glutamate--tRNA ligase family protein [Verrucomicrobiales bacterium]|nr:glutamate--tRNA ligase family protein [Verrucomicrobiales bacterium]